MTVETIPLGHVPSMSNDAYHSSPGVSKSHLDDIAEECGNSPRHYYDARLAPDRPEDERTKALENGQAIHDAILEPDLFSSAYVVAPADAPRRPSTTQLKAKKPSAETLDAIAFWEDFDAANEGRTVLTTEQMEIAVGARDSVHRHPQIAGLFRGGAAEQAFFAIDPETGELVKCKADYIKLDHGIIVDLKSAESACGDSFGNSGTKYRYDVQDPWYRDTVNLALDAQVIENFAFVAIEKKRPFAAGLYFLTPEQITVGRLMARRDLRRIAECRASGHWPDFAEKPRKMRIRPAARAHLA